MPASPTPPDGLDIGQNRQARKYSRREMALRVLWMPGQWLLRLSPRPFFGWRRFVLRLFGAQVGPHVNVYPSTRIYMPWNLRVGAWAAIGEDVLVYNLGPVTIGERATISHRAHLCAGTHDHTLPDLPLLKPPIVVEAQAWVCADALVGPGVTVGEGAVVGAGAVAMRDVSPWTIVSGNPARPVKERVLRSP
ncbi:MAG: putative colanic acid biosynthesis acetyltransferase [Rubricoccaceae bacterium]